MTFVNGSSSQTAGLSKRHPWFQYMINLSLITRQLDSEIKLPLTIDYPLFLTLAHHDF